LWTTRTVLRPSVVAHFVPLDFPRIIHAACTELFHCFQITSRGLKTHAAVHYPDDRNRPTPASRSLTLIRQEYADSGHRRSGGQKVDHAPLLTVAGGPSTDRLLLGAAKSRRRATDSFGLTPPFKCLITATGTRKLPIAVSLRTTFGLIPLFKLYLGSIRLIT